MRPFPIAVPPPATAVPATAAEVPAPAPTTVPPQPEPPPPSEKRPTVATRISYVDGQLRIDAFDITRADVLTKVADLTGVIIEIPPGSRTRSEERRVGK